MTLSASVPFAEVALAPPRVDVRGEDNGVLYLSSPVALAETAETTDIWLRHWAKTTPARPFIAARPNAGDGVAQNSWQTLTYADADRMVSRIATALLNLGAGPDHPLLILSGNSLNHAVLALAALRIGVPIVPVSPAYSLISRDYAKVKHIAKQVAPQFVYVEAIAPFAAALQALPDMERVTLLTGDSGVDAPAGFHDVQSFDALSACGPDEQAVSAAAAAITADSIAKILFTSGSTGMPKGVINTHRMLTANQAQIIQTQPFVAEEPPVLVDWLPWNHTFGGNYTFNLVLSNGGTLYIDSGRPLAGAFDQTIVNLKEIAPTMLFNVPAAFGMLVPALEKDAAFRNHLFSRLKQVFYSGAGLPQDLWRRLDALSEAARNERVLMVSSWGATETAPLVTAVHWPIERAGIVGLPVPGVTLKLVPNGGKLEARVKGPNVTPGYFRDVEKTKAAFDEEGFYIVGDALAFADETDPAKGLVFDGRVSEDFKLLTGTWVSVGNVRLAVLAAMDGLLQDAVIAGEGRGEIGLLAWLNPVRAREVAGDRRAHSGAQQDQGEIHRLLKSPDLHKALRQRIEAYNRQAPGSSTRIGRMALLTTLPDIDAGEITDKGYLNQRAVLDARAYDVNHLFDGGLKSAAPFFLEIPQR